MSALDEYRKAVHAWENTPMHDEDEVIAYGNCMEAAADAAIAELQAENEKSLAALFDAQQAITSAEKVVLELQAELAALKARRCEGCLHAGDISKSGTPSRVCKMIWGWVPLSGGCDQWEARP